MTEFRIEVDLSDVYAELDRLGGGPGLDTRKRLAALISTGFAATQAVVHIITGSLRTSGKDDVSWDGATWTGEISYGGEAAGAINDPVTYAALEQQRAFGGAFYETRRGDIPGRTIGGDINTDHNFMWPLEGTDHLYGDVVLAFLKGTAR